MPRPNPESTSELTLCQTSYAGSFQTSTRSYIRTYASSNSPGYPQTLRFNPHSVDIKRQWLDPNAFWQRERISGYPYSNTWAHGPMDGTGRGLGGSLRTHFTNANDAIARAQTKLALEVKRDKVNIAVNLAEAGRSFSMFEATAKRIAGAYRALRHGDIPGVRRNIYVKPKHAASLLHRGPLDIRRHAPQYWLELQYGWRPLLGDLYGAVTQLHSRVEEGYPIRAKASSGYTRKRSLDDVVCVGIVRADYDQTQVGYVLLVVDYWVDNSSSANLNDWGVTNPLEVVWELVPYSFVVDWFIPIGNYLSTFDAYLGVTFKQGLQSVLQESQGVAHYEAIPEPAASATLYKRVVRGTDSFQHLTFTRTLLTSFPRAGLPRLKNPFSAMHVANAVSLLSTAFDSKTRYRFR